MKEKIERIFYDKILRGLIFTSRLGRKSMMGYADSGINFDYIYRNAPSGYSRIGKMVDRILLNLPAAKATRNRKNKIIEILKDEIENNKRLSKKTKIVDLASGPARYLIELISDYNKDHVEILCLDLDRRALALGKKQSQNKPILYKKANVLRFNPHYKRISEKHSWKPNLVLISGLYEYQEDKIVIESLKYIHENLEDNGLLFLITQIGNPNRKLIEKLGITRSGKSWVLFYRDPPTLNHFIEESGFGEISIEIDKWKMYAFCTARKLMRREKDKRE